MTQMTNGEKLMPVRSIYKTLAFFDAQDMALTQAEVENYAVLGEENGNVENKDGLYFLSGRQELVYQRRMKYRITLERLRKAKKYLRFLRHFPYLRAVALSGSAALLNSTPESDIDLFIITKRNRVWIARALVSAYFQIIGERRHGHLAAGRFCLNHYLAEDTEITEDRNLYTAVEYASLLPVLGAAQLEKFWQKNGWIKEHLPHAQFTKGLPFFGFTSSRASRVLELFMDYTLAPALNYLLGLYQKHRIRRQEHILVSDDELSFHPGSHGQKVLALYKKKTSLYD